MIGSISELEFVDVKWLVILFPRKLIVVQDDAKIITSLVGDLINLECLSVWSEAAPSLWAH